MCRTGSNRVHQLVNYYQAYFHSAERSIQKKINTTLEQLSPRNELGKLKKVFRANAWIVNHLTPEKMAQNLNFFPPSIVAQLLNRVSGRYPWMLKQRLGSPETNLNKRKKIGKPTQRLVCLRPRGWIIASPHGPW